MPTDSDGRHVERFLVYEPSDGTAGLAVTLHPDAGPHETLFTLDQLWPPREDEETGRAEPVYVGDAQRAVGLVEALSQALDTAFEAGIVEVPDRGG